MQQRSALFDQTVAGSHKLLVSADVLSGGVVVATGLPVVSGTVTADRKQFARRTCTVVIGDPAYIPTGQPTRTSVATGTEVLLPGSSGSGGGGFGTAPFGSAPFGMGGGGGYTPDVFYTTWTSTTVEIAADLLAPYGNEIRLWRGAVTPAGPELICVGTFGIRSVEFDDGGAFKGITVTGIDRCKRLQETRFTYPRSVGQFSAIEQARALIWEVIPGVEIRVDPRLPDVVMPQVTWSQKRDDALTDIVTALGAELFCDPYGAFVLQPVPSPTDPPAFTVTSGPGGVLVSARHSLTRDGVFNGVIARASSTISGTAEVVSDLVVDDDPTSPTYWDKNGFGEIVGFYDSSLLTSYTQANTAAQSLLLNQMGAARSLNYSQAVNPAIEPGDVGAVVNPRTGETERHLHDQITIPLDAKGVMTAQTRSTTSTVLHSKFIGALS